MDATNGADLGSVVPITSMADSPVRLFLVWGLSFGRPRWEGTEQMRAVKGMPPPPPVTSGRGGQRLAEAAVPQAVKAPRLIRQVEEGMKDLTPASSFLQFPCTCSRSQRSRRPS